MSTLRLVVQYERDQGVEKEHQLEMWVGEKLQEPEKICVCLRTPSAPSAHEEKEKDMGKKILCAGTKRKLHAALREHGDGELEESLLVDWSEYVPDAKSKGHRAEASMGATRPTPRGESRTPRRFTEEERAEMRRKMSRARAAEVLPAEALDEVPMTHFEYTRGKW